MADDLMTAALEEAYASAPPDDVILSTLEFRHPSFVDGDGNAIGVRILRDYGVLLQSGDPDVYGREMGLEAGAALNAGETVQFIACMFDFTPPGSEDTGLPEIEISFDNVTRFMAQYLDAAMAYRANVEVTYREYLLSDLTAPAFVLDGLLISKCDTTLTRITATASFSDLINTSFPKKLYRQSEFPGISS